MDINDIEDRVGPANWAKICYAVNIAERQNWLDPVKKKFGVDSRELVIIYANHLDSRVPLPKYLSSKRQAGGLVDRVLTTD